MFESIKGRIAVIVGLVALCGWTLMPQEGPEGNTISPLNLGLDLQGGMHLAVELASDTALSEQARSDALDRVLTTIRNRVNEFGVREPIIQKVGNERIIVELAGIDNPDRAKEIVSQTAFLSFNIVRTDNALMDRLERIDRAIVEAVGEENLRAAGGAGGDISEIFGAAGGGDTVAPSPGDTAAPDTASAGQEGLPPALGGGADTGQAADDTTAGDTAGEGTGMQGLPGMDQGAGGQQGGDEGVLRPLSQLLLQSGQSGVFLVQEQDVPTVRKFLAMDAVRELLPGGIQLNWSANTVGQGGNVYRQLYVLADDPLITGEYLADAGPAQRDPTYNQPIVPFEMTRRGARIFERGTSRNVGEQMAIILDGRVQSAPVIQQTLSRRAQIELGQGTLQEAQDLALVLRAGALPVPIEIVSERTVGPSLGEDSIRQGRTAFIIGLALVVLAMIAYYRIAGAMAVGALCVYVILVLGGLAGLEATLTLPGIAGIILSVGMAVDANVLIFERIREEQAAGKTPRTSVEEGFSHALSAIVDANLTTLITAIILYQVGTGPVQGFAVTLAIGIIASFVTALYVTRTFFMIYLDRHSPTDPVSI